MKFSTFVETFGIDLVTSNTQKSSTANNPVLASLEARDMVIERKKSSPGCIVIKCSWEHLHSSKDKGTCYYEPNTNGYRGHAYKCFHSHCQDRTITDLKSFLEIQEGAQIAFSKDPMPLVEELLPVAYFTEDLLPANLQAWVMDCSERMQAPPDFFAVALIVGIGSLLGRKVGIYPKAKDNWHVVANIWGAVVGRPSGLKSPSLAVAIKFLDELATDANLKHKNDMDNYQSDLQWQKAQQKAQIDKLQKAAQTSKDRPKLDELDSVNEPVEKRYKTSDATQEKLGEILLQNPQGILLYRDELVGWFKNLEKYGHESDRSFYLESWNGNGNYTVDRIGRGTRQIPALCLSILGGIQPGPLKSYIYQATAGGAGDDGLLQRFQLIVWPDMLKEWKNVDRYADSEAEERVRTIFRRLDAFEPFEPLKDDAFKSTHALSEKVLKPLNPQLLRFSPQAQELFDEWRYILENVKLKDQKISSALESHLAKYRS